MSLANTAGTSLDEYFPGMIVERNQRSAEGKHSPGPGDFLKTSSASDKSVDYSKSPGSCTSPHSHGDLSEDFISEGSGETLHRTCLEPLRKYKNEKKNIHVSKVSICKGPRGIATQRQLVWNPQPSMTAPRREAVTQRILSARLNMIKELRNEVADVTRRLEAMALENQVLRQVQYRHLKALGRYEHSQHHLPQVVARHQSEVQHLRQLLKNSQGKERSMTRKLREMDQELLRTKDVLQQLQRLSEDKNLAEREELTQKLSVLTSRLEGNDKKIQRLEKQLKLNHKVFNQQLVAESRKTLAAQATNKTLQVEMKHLQQKLKEKERELEIRNIYTHRLLRNLCEPQDGPKGALTKATQADRRSCAFVTQKHQETQKSYEVPALTEKVKLKAGRSGQREKVPEASGPLLPPVDKRPSQDEANGRHQSDLPAGRAGPPRRGRTPTEAAPRTRAGASKAAADRPGSGLGPARPPPAPSPAPSSPAHAPGQPAAPPEEPEQPAPPSPSPSPGRLPGSPSGLPPRPEPEREPEPRPRPRRSRGSPEPEPPPPWAPPASRPPPRPRKRYSFSEATENLHLGLPAHAHAHAHHGAYQPSCGQARRTRGPAADDAPRDTRSDLLRRLFGAPEAEAQASPGRAARGDPAGTPSPPEGIAPGSARETLWDAEDRIQSSEPVRTGGTPGEPHGARPSRTDTSRPPS